MAKKKTTEEFKKEVYDKVGNEYEVLGEYINSSTHIKMKHSKCGYIYPVVPNSFLRGSRCPQCGRESMIRKRRKTAEEFKNQVYDKVKDEYEVLDEYINSSTPIKMKHNKCGCIYPVRPNDFLKGSRCPECAKMLRVKNQRKKIEDFKDEVYHRVGGEYEVLGDYINTDTPILMKHNECGCIYPVTPHNFLKGTRCPECYGNKKRTPEEFKQEVYDKVKDEYSVLSEYNNSNTPIKMKHNKCGHIYPVRPDKFLRGNRCPKCNSSKGELAIIKFLNKYNINYKHNKPYGDCSYKRPLKFDFLIFDKENRLKLIVEYDGEMHFIPVKAFGGEEAFEKTKARDKVKNDFCKEKNISLLRIPYWEIDNIHKILGKKLYKLGLISNETV